MPTRIRSMQKKARPTARAGRVPSETSLGWLSKMITGNTEYVNK